MQLRGVEEVVFDGISGAEQLHVAQRRDGLQGLELYGYRQRRREAVEIVFGGRLPLGLEEQLVLFLVGEGDYLGLDAGAIAGADALYLAVVEGRFGQAASQYLVRLAIGIDGVARALAHGAALGGEIRELVPVVVALLQRGQREVYRPSVYPDGGAGLHAVGAKSEADQLFGQSSGRRFGYTSALDFDGARVHQSVQERAGGHHHAACPEGDAEGRDHARNPAILDDEAVDRILPHIQPGSVLEYAAPSQRECHAVGLSAGAPHGRTLGSVEHPELYRGPVGDYARHAAEGVDLAHYLPFCDATHGGVAAHMGNLVHVDGDEQGRRAEACRGVCRLAAGVSGSDHNHVIIEEHIFWSISLMFVLCVSPWSRAGRGPRSRAPP